MPVLTEQNIPDGSPLSVVVPPPFVPEQPKPAGSMVLPSWVPPVVGLAVAIGSAILDVSGLGAPLSVALIMKAALSGFIAWFGGKSAGSVKLV